MASSSSRSSSENDTPAVAQAGHRGLGGGERGAQVVADRGEQCGTHPVRFGERARCGSLLGEPLLPQCESGLGGERLDDAPVAGVEGVAAQHQGQLAPSLPGSPAAVTGTSTSPSPGNAQGGPPTHAATCHAAGSCWSSGPPGTSARRSSSVTDSRPKVSRSRSSSAVRGRSPRKHAAGDRGQGGGFGAGLGSLAGSPRGQVDHGADRCGDRDEHDQCQNVLPFGDGEGVQRRGEEEVQQQ